MQCEMSSAYVKVFNDTRRCQQSRTGASREYAPAIKNGLHSRFNSLPREISSLHPCLREFQLGPNQY